MSPATATAGGPGFVLTVKGTNFAAGDTIEFDNFLLTSTYVSPTEMHAQVPASAIAAAQTVTVIVVTSPPAALNFGSTFTILSAPSPGNTGFTVSGVSIQANDMVWDPVSKQIYLSVVKNNPSNGDTITALNPSTGQLGISQNSGGQPDRIAVASDGSYLYVGIDGNGSIQRFTLPNLQTDINIPLGSFSGLEPYYAMDVEAQPGHPHTIAAVRGAMGSSPIERGGVAIYDDAVPRSAAVPGANSGTGPIDAIVWNSNGTDIYGADNEYTPDYGDLYVLSVDSSGVQVASGHQQAAVNSYGTLHYDATTGYVYGDSGQAVDPSTGTTLGSFPLAAVQLSGQAGPTALANRVMVPDGTLNIAYFLGQIPGFGSPGNYILEAFDLTHLTLIGSVEIPNVVGTPVKMIRWGSNGLAFLTGNGNGPTQGDGVYLISGTFVSNPAVQ